MKNKGLCKQVKAGALAAALLVSSFSANVVVSAEEIISYEDGTYTGVATGKNGDVSVSVTLKDGKVVEASEVSQQETPGLWAKATALFTTINEKQPTFSEIDEIDGISGATISSNAIKAAVKDAFSQAEKKSNPEEPEEPENPGTPEDPENPENPENPTDSDDTIKGEGTEENPYLISNVKQLELFAKNVDEGNSYAGEYVSLTNDITLSSSQNFNSIGTSDGFDIFAGTFDGNNYSIYNMTINSENVSDEGLFTALKAGAVVKNLKVMNASITATPDYGLNAGIITGDLKRTAIISNCQVSGKINVKSDSTAISVGGIAGNMMVKSEVKSCYSDVDIIAELNDGVMADIGGIAGLTKMNSKIIDSTSAGTISAKGDTSVNAGGIVGTAMGTTENVVSKMTIKTDGTTNTIGDEWKNKDVDSSIFEAGDGSKENPYQISNVEQLVAFAGSLEESVLYDNKYVELMSDIDISGIDNWEPVGGSQYAFNGTFDGKGHTINGLREGTKSNPRRLSKNVDDFSNALGLFGNIGVDAVVKNLHLTNVAIYAYREDASFVGGIVGYMQGLSDSVSYKGAVIDNCSVQGTIESTTAEKNAYVGGIAARQYKGAIINCHTDVSLRSKVEYGESIASVGGIAGMTNRGLVANCYSTGTYFGSMARDIENEIEGMSAVGAIVGVNAGDLVNCYGRGDTESEHYSIYTGAITGWVTGIGKAYQSYFDIEKTMKIAGRKEAQVQPYGTKTVGGVNEEGVAYEGGVVGSLESFTSETYSKLVEKLNSNFETFGIDFSKYGLMNDCFRKWKLENNIVTLSDEFVNTIYLQPEEEKVPVTPIVMGDGDWYGRDNAGKVTVKITVKNNELVSESIISGSKSDSENYEKALARAKDKAIYGDRTGYGPGDEKQFAGGNGTKESPYLISNEKQLRYLAEAINADETWEGKYFKQTADIKLSDKEWLPIGFAIKAKIKGDPILYSAYPFRGNYDGDGYTITGLTIGTRSNPASQYTAAMFGFTGGDYETNLTYGDDTLKVELKNINLRDIYINNEVSYDTYTAGLVGTGQNGVFIDNCSVTGKISVKADDIASRGAGLAASMLRGEVTNCYTDVSIRAITEEGDVYAGGMFSVTNRINVLNCYALGDVYGNANTNNKVHIGGFTGMAGAFQYNCYAMGNVTSNRPTVDIGIMDGRIANIAYDRNCYFNQDAKIIENGSEIKAVYTGADGTGSSKDVTFGKPKEEIGSKDFAALLNENVKNVVSELETADNELGGIMSIYYNRGAAGLKNWGVKNGIAVLTAKEIKKEDNKQSDTINSSTEKSSESSSDTSNRTSSAVSSTTKIAELGNNNTALIPEVQVPMAGKKITAKSNVKLQNNGNSESVVKTESLLENEDDESAEDAVSEGAESEEDAKDTVVDISPEVVPAAAEAESNTGIIIFIIVLVLAISGVGGAILLRRKNFK
ncbi:FMN-binding protein [Butyrivibrio fibrisolvens]|uniref:FMN-binding protein n=1 Tax=Pseudobutyrivibrio ruminis TaxID=46206 RepID=UPI0003F6DEE0|nr:FMN-binding protein [Pseudobutyrivibrio ruminis]MDC7279492.1 FMN-binding protein [Butyrivibrio fibrisolvens]